MRPLAPTCIPRPRIQDAHCGYEPLAWVAYDAANPRVEVQVSGINEAQARTDGAIKLRVDAWRVRVRPAIRSSQQA
jgi:hypothetical protein